MSHQPSFDCGFNLPFSLRPPASRNSSKHLNMIFSHRVRSGSEKWTNTVGATQAGTKERRSCSCLCSSALWATTRVEPAEKILPNTSMAMAVTGLVVDGGPFPLILVPFSFVFPFLSPPNPSFFLPLCSWDKRRKPGKVHHVAVARWRSHYQVLSTSQQSYTSIIQRLWNKAVCLFCLLRKKERIANEKAKRRWRFQCLCN